MAGPLGLHLTSTDISQMLLESVKGSGGINFSKSSGSDVNYTWEEKQNETDEVVEEGMGCPTNFIQGTKNPTYLIVGASEK
jgi:hypothetical protein